MENMFSLTSPENEQNYFIPFEMGEGIKYDAESMQADIEKYGLYTYEDFAEYMSYEQFVSLNIRHLKVSVGKGYVTYEQLVALIEKFKPILH